MNRSRDSQKDGWTNGGNQNLYIYYRKRRKKDGWMNGGNQNLYIYYRKRRKKDGWTNGGNQNLYNIPLLILDIK